MDFQGNVKENNGTSLQRTDSFRKVLPSKPSATVDSRLSMSMKMIDRPVAPDVNNSSNKMFLPYMLEYAIMAEYQLLQKQDLNGIYVIPSDQDALVWYGVIFVRQGLYQGGIFRFRLHFPETFPDGPCPKVIFESNVFHPAINGESGELNVCEEFKEWKRKMHHVWQVLLHVRRIFYTVDTNSPVNEIASEMLINDNAKFKEFVRLCVEESQNLVYQTPHNDDLNYLHFEPYKEDLHGAIMNQILNINDSTIRNC